MEFKVILTEEKIRKKVRDKILENKSLVQSLLLDMVKNWRFCLVCLGTLLD